MKAMSRRVLVLYLCGMTLLLSGCAVLSGGVETQLRPPEISKEQAAIRAALESYLEQNNGERAVYTLRFPHSGAYRTAYVMQDIDGDGVEEAFVFYTPDGEIGDVHLHFLHKVDGVWCSADDFESDSADVREVAFADIGGDGRRELLVGWERKNAKDYQLTAFSFAENRLDRLASYYYDTFLLRSVVSSDRSDMLLFRTGAPEAASLRLISEQEGALTEVGTVLLGDRVQGFGRMLTTQLSEQHKALMVDLFCEDSVIRTELVYWDGTQLTAPFRGADGGPSVETGRESGLYCADIDGDGRVEWPQSTLLPEYTSEEGSSRMWLTHWYEWELDTRSIRRKATMIVNAEDGYAFTVQDELVGKLTAYYLAAEHKMVAVSWDDGKASEELLRIRRIYGEEAQEPDTRRITLRNGAVLEVWYRGDTEKTVDEILYLLTGYSQEKNGR